MEALKARPDDETTFVPKAPGSFQRGANNVQHWIDRDPGAEFPAEKGRYHLFLNYGCGWSHQVLMLRALRGLQEAVGVTHTGLYRHGARGTPEYEGFLIFPGTDTSGLGLTSMSDVYNRADGKYGKNQLTIPALLCKTTARVVSNDPAQILLMLDFLADELRGAPSDCPCLYPPSLQQEIEAVNAVVFPGINNGVYCCWFGGAGEAFQEGFDLVQAALLWMEERLAKGGPFLCGTERPTLADVRAFPHLYRFDSIYFELMMRQQGARIFGGSRFPHLSAWVRRMFALPEVWSACDLQVATRFYFSSKPVEESDAIYDRERELANAEVAWLPTREEWAVKRAEEGMVEAQIDIPVRA